MNLNFSERSDLLNKACAINGLTPSAVARLLKSANKADQSKVDAVAKTLESLKSMQIAKKIEQRDDKSTKSVLKAISSKLTPYEAWIAQSKNPDMMKSSSWVKRIFEKKTADSYEKVALLSNSCISIVKEMDPYQANRSQAICEPDLMRSAAIFCKRFGL